MNIKSWEDRQKESTEEFNDMPLAKWHFMEREIKDLRAEVDRLNKLITQLQQ